MMRFVEAEAACAGVGKRLCTEAEWELACEGPRTVPWPYGLTIRPGACNTDQPFRPYDEARLTSSDEDVRDKETGRLYQGTGSGTLPACQSAFGVFDLVGNVEEWVLTSRRQWPYRSALKGGYWSKPWAACRGTNERHGPTFRYYQIGFRCCAQPAPAQR
jgi:formylglycine-generating enzyme required for sulfatase activity